LALNGRFYTALGISPFFAIYGYDIPLPVVLDIGSNETTALAALERAATFIEKIKKITNIYQ
ncbi:hypothetical protein SMMN14_08987, partial [Sphaerulina musiva]